jgi:hypothetical protein
MTFSADIVSGDNSAMSIEIDSDFPGGNIVIENVDGDDVRLHQDLRDTPSDWFYWCFCVRGAEGRTLRFTFTRSCALGVRGPAVSLDDGETWNWLGNDVVNGSAFSYVFPKDAPKVMVSFAMPYQESHWLHFVDGLSNPPLFSCHKLCTTAKGRDVEYMLVGCQGAEPQHRVAITCRHHCCEMMTNYVLEGLFQWVVEDSGAESQWLRDNVQFFLVPFMDKDGVEDGDQGKGRQPRDHGRDYEGESMFASTEAIRRLLPGWGGDQLRVGLDLHCPWISGAHHEVIYLVGSQHHRIVQEQQRFSEILESVGRGPLPFLAADFLPFGRAWNTEKNYLGGKEFSCWVAGLPAVALGTTIEIPYANAGGAEVNQESARSFGKDLGMALTSYLRTLPKSGHNNQVEAMQ